MENEEGRRSSSAPESKSLPSNDDKRERIGKTPPVTENEGKEVKRKRDRSQKKDEERKSFPTSEKSEGRERQPPATEHKQPDSLSVPVQVDEQNATTILKVDAVNDLWKQELRTAIRDSQQAFTQPQMVNESEADKYYRMIVKVPRVTKSYYDRLQSGKGFYIVKKHLSDSDMHKQKVTPRPGNVGTIGRPVTGKNVGPSQARSNLNTYVEQKPKPSKKAREEEKDAGDEGEVLNYFDPEMVQLEYQKLLGKSRNIVVGPPAQILQKYFGYSKDDPLPVEFRHDPSPKAFILPKHLWKEYDDIKGKQKLKFGDGADRKKDQDKWKRTDGKDLIVTPELLLKATQPVDKGPLSTPSPFDLFMRPAAGKPSTKVASDAPKPPMTPLVFQKIEKSVDHKDPRYYEPDRTKCERKRRREIDDEMRLRESEYEVICGSGLSSEEFPVDDNEPPEPTKNKRRISGVDSAPNLGKTGPPTQSGAKKRQSWPNFVDREGSDLSIELGPDPMQRLPRDNSNQYRYYRSYPMYPTLSNETFYEWYKDINRLQDPFAPKKHLRPAGDSKSSPEAGYLTDDTPTPTRNFVGSAGKRYPFVPRSSLLDSKPERADYNTKDYVYDNARSVMLMPPKKPLPRYVDDRNGTTHLLEPSGLMHKYVYRGDFGRIPGYLVFRNEEQGRPPMPDFDKFYRFHRCKFLHGHIHCKTCNSIHPLHKGSGDCDDNEGGEDCLEEDCRRYYNHLCDYVDPRTVNCNYGETEKQNQPGKTTNENNSAQRNSFSSSKKSHNSRKSKDSADPAEIRSTSNKENQDNPNLSPINTENIQFIVNKMNELALQNDVGEILGQYSILRSIPKKKSCNFIQENGNWQYTGQSQNFVQNSNDLIRNSRCSSYDTGSFIFKPLSNVHLYPQ